MFKKWKKKEIWHVSFVIRAHSECLTHCKPYRCAIVCTFHISIEKVNRQIENFFKCFRDKNRQTFMANDYNSILNCSLNKRFRCCSMAKAILCILIYVRIATTISLLLNGQFQKWFLFRDWNNIYKIINYIHKLWLKMTLMDRLTLFK